MGAQISLFKNLCNILENNNQTVNFWVKNCLHPYTKKHKLCMCHSLTHPYFLMYVTIRHTHITHVTYLNSFNSANGH